MSRYELRNDAYYEVVVGYDDPLGTFFSQVYDVTEGNRQGDDVLVYQTGTRPAQVTSVEECLVGVAQWVNVDADRLAEVAAALARDKMNRRMPTEFQRETFKKLTGEELP